MIKRWTILLIVISFIALSARAQQKRTLTIKQAIQIGMESSKALRTSQFKVDVADAKSSEANTYRLPSLKFNGTYTRLSKVDPTMLSFPGYGTNDPVTNHVTLIPVPVQFGANLVNSYGLKGTIQQPLYTGGKISGAANAAEYISDATKEDYKKDKAEVQYNIKAAYWNLFRANEFKKFIDENVNQIKSHAKDAENLMKQGMLTSNDLMKVQVQLSDALVRQIDATNNVKLAMYALNNTLGLPLQTEIELASTIQIDERKWDNVDQLIVNAFEKRPEVLGMNARVKAGESGLTSARGGWWPQIYLIGNYNYMRPNQRIFPTVDQFKDTWDVTLSLSFDIWNWWQTGYQANQAQAQLAQAEEGVSMMKDGVMLEVTQSYLGVNQFKERKAVAEQGVKQAEENYRVMDDKYKLGMALNSELLDAEVMLLQAKLNLTQSLVDYELSIARLSKAIGE
jgi:outer membrane protein